MKNNHVLIVIILLLCVLAGCRTPDSIYYPQTNSTNGDETAVYSDILTDYRNLIDFRLSDAFMTDWNNGNIPRFSEQMESALKDEYCERTTYEMSIGEKWSNMIVEMTAGIDLPQKSNYGYFLADINEDSFPELFWVRSDQMLLAIFSVQNGRPVLLDACWHGYKCVLTDVGMLYTRADGGAGYITFGIRQLSEEINLLVVKEFGAEGGNAETGTLFYEITETGKVSINEARFNQLIQDYPFAMSEFWYSKIYWL